jgi:hypothetical protein
MCIENVWNNITGRNGTTCYGKEDNSKHDIFSHDKLQMDIGDQH